MVAKKKVNSMKKIKSVLQGTLLVLLISSCSDNDRYEIYQVNNKSTFMLDKKNGHVWRWWYSSSNIYSNRSKYKGVPREGVWIDCGIVTDENNKHVIKKLERNK